tara:strand:- start:293 stop:796 length:504 start_codon:yes stop_codon:yes gene_type:complete
MKLVVVESPYGKQEARNKIYAKSCVLDSIYRGECPLASHLLYTQYGILMDSVKEERQLGMMLGRMPIAYGKADLVAVYFDLGISEGMKLAIDTARVSGIRIDWRMTGAWDLNVVPAAVVSLAIEGELIVGLSKDVYNVEGTQTLEPKLLRIQIDALLNRSLPEQTEV